MRIICPGCEAQYEVPDNVIPDEGRDVQCSNCGTTWMFGGAGASGAARAPAEEAEDAESDEADTPPVAAPPRRELDPKVAGILRAEAERESAARSADPRPQPLEVQPDLGLGEGAQPPRREAPPPPPRAAEERPAAKASDTSRPGNMTVAAATAAKSRGDLLPDIEEINSSLRSTGDRDVAHDPAPDTAAEPGRRRGFGSGFLVALLIFAALVLAYQFAPEIAEAVPQADPWLSGYVTWVDGLRAELDATVRQALSWLDAQAASTGG